MASINYINGGTGSDILYGGSGNDVIHGFGGNDRLYGGDRIDHLYGGDGNDDLYDINGDMFGNSGVDTLHSNYRNSSYQGIYFGAEGKQIIKDISQNSRILSFNSIENFEVFGTDYDDIFDVRVIGEGEIEFWGGEGNDTFYSNKRMGRHLNGALFGEQGEDTFIATEGYLDGGVDTDTLIADYSSLSYGGQGIEFGYYSGFVYENGVRAIGTFQPLLTFQGIEIFEITGTRHNDIFHSQGESSFFKGGAGNDTFIGEKGTFDGGSGNYDHLRADYSNSSQYQSGIYIDLKEGEIRTDSSHQLLLSYQGIETFEITATQYDDTLIGSDGNDVLRGDRGDDYIEGGAGNDHLFARSGADQLDGGAGNDYLYAVTNVSNNAVHKDLWGGEGADTFVIDQQGSIGLAFDFNVNLLRNFVSDITYPDLTGSGWEDYASDIGFSLLAASAGAVPVVGSVMGFAVDMIEMGVNGFREQGEIQEKIQNHIDRVNQTVDRYSNSNWGAVTVQGQRDTITIHDFTPGLDTIVLPELDIVVGQSNPSYVVDLTNQDRAGGATISIKNQPVGGNDIELVKEAVFIANSFQNYGVTDAEFQELVADLLVGSVVGTFKQTSTMGLNQVSTVETIQGTLANDTILASGGDDEVFGHYGHDFLYGQDGNDLLHGGTNGDSNLQGLEEIYGHDGNDFLIGGAGDDELRGETGNDNLWGGDGNDLLKGGAGDDVLRGDTDIDAPIVGENGNAVNRNITQGEGNDILDGGLGNDSLDGGNGDDILDGGSGNDDLTGGSGNDFLTGGAGNDILRGDNRNITQGEGDDILDGGLGIDTVEQWTDGDITLTGNTTSATLTGANNDQLESIEKVKLFGGSSNNQLDASQFTGSVELSGKAGDDTLTGGNGNDILTGGNGNDILTGGTGADRFNFSSPAEGIDTITDFQVGLDKLQLDASEFGGYHSLYFGGISYNSNTGVLSFDADFFNAWLPIPFASSSYDSDPEPFAILENAPAHFNPYIDIVMV